MQERTTTPLPTPQRARTRLTRHARRMLMVAAVSLGLSGATLAHDYRIGQIHIDHPWARATLAGQRVAGGYLTLENGGEADKLLAVETEVSESVELHTMSMEGNVMRMREVDHIELPAGATVELKPGGLHIMFVGLKRPLKEGESFAARLRFERAGSITVEMQVESAQGKEAGHGGHGSHTGGPAHGGHGGHAPHGTR